MKEKFLPIGTVILLKDATKRMMITGYCSATPEDPNKTYDYVGCLFPEGNLAGDEVALFDHDKIGSISYMGLDDDEFKKFDTKIKGLLAEEEKKKPAPTPQDLMFGSGRLEDLPPLNPENLQKLLHTIKSQGIQSDVKEPTAFSEDSMKKPNFSKDSLTKDDKKKKEEEEEEKLSNSFSVESYEQEKKEVHDGTPVLQLQLIGADGNVQPSQPSQPVLAVEQPSIASVESPPVEMPTLTPIVENTTPADGGSTASVIPGLERL